jgi:hypothetical protein
MKVIKYLIMSSVLLIVVACVHRPIINPQLRCFNQYAFNYGTEAEINAFFSDIEKYKDDPELQKKFLKDVLSLFGKARCNMYDLNTVEPVDPNGGFDKPLSEVDLYGGFSFPSWAVEISPWGKESIQYYEDTCSTKKRTKREEKKIEKRLERVRNQSKMEGKEILKKEFETHHTDLF